MFVTGAALELRTSPHVKSTETVEVIMRNVVYALLPIAGFAVYLFGLSAAAVLATATASCVATEYIFCKLRRRASTIRDFSVVITGILLALTLPPGFPLWMTALGGFVGVALGKQLFGGLGFNLFNPALIGRAFLQAAFPGAITTYTPAFTPGRFAAFIPSTLAAPLMKPAPVQPWIERMAVDGFAGATPLTLEKFEHVHTGVASLLFGLTAGSAGETCAALIIICGAYLALRRMMDWRIPAAMLGAALATSAVFHLINAERYPDPFFMLFSGGLVLGAVFMASDMVASPVTPLGVWIYGGFMGVVTIMIRLFGGLPEGVMYAILLGNAVSPLIDNLTQPRAFGARRQAKKAT